MTATEWKSPVRVRYGVFFYENFEENWPCHNGTTLYSLPDELKQNNLATYQMN